MQGLNIEQILEEEGERYLPLLHHILERSTPGFAFSGDSDGRIKRLRLAILARNAFLFGELKKVLKAFAEEDIEAILLKGAMMEGIYPAGLRPFTDIDFLIHRQKLPQAIEILHSLGYQAHGWPVGHREDAFLCEVGCVKKGDITTYMEAHWLLGAPYSYEGRVDIEGMWQRANKVDIAGLHTLILCPEDSLLHSCLHLFKHHRHGWLASSCDIAELTYRYEGKLDWEAFLNRVFEFRLCLPVRYSLQKTIELFHPPIPDFVLDNLGSYKPDRFEKRIFASLANPGDKHSGNELDWGRSIVLWLLTMPGARSKIRYLWNMYLPSRKYMLGRYAINNPRLLPFYYLLRLKYAFLMALKALFALACRRKSGQYRIMP